MNRPVQTEIIIVILEHLTDGRIKSEIMKKKLRIVLCLNSCVQTGATDTEHIHLKTVRAPNDLVVVLLCQSVKY